jgi:hypothetical protein
MKCIKKTGLLFCGIMLIAAQSCVRDGLDSCPPSIRYALSFEYLLHTVDVNGDGIHGGPGDNLFAEDVDKMCIYIFDDITGLCIYVDTTLTGPFSNDYIYSLPLVEGIYDIVVWGWGRHTGDPALHRSTGIIPAIGLGDRIDEARFVISELNGVVDVDGKIEKTFYGEIPELSIPPFSSRIDTVSLKNIAKMIRIIIPDIDNDPENFPDWQNNIRIGIEGDNGAYKFNGVAGMNGPLLADVPKFVRYNPFQTFFDDDILSEDPIYSTQFDDGNHEGLVVDISTLRLIEYDVNMKIVITWQNREGAEEWTEISLLELVTRNPDYAWSTNIQRDLDRDDRWEVIFRIMDTNVSVATNIMQWHLVKQDVSAGGIRQ